MYALLAVPAVSLLIALAVSVAPIFDFRSRPLPGSIGTCAFGRLPEPEPTAAALSPVRLAA